MKYLVCLLILLFVQSPAVAQMGPPQTLTAQEFGATLAGQSVALAVRVLSRERTTLDAELLDRVAGERYRATGKRVTLFLAAETPYVMGSEADVKSGAVLAVYAIITTPAHADVKRVVVITPYVSVQ